MLRPTATKTAKKSVALISEKTNFARAAHFLCTFLCLLFCTTIT